MLTNHIGLRVRDIEKSKAFYFENLGFQLDHKFEDEKKVLVFLKNENSVIELIYVKNEAYNFVQSGIVNHIAFTVDDIHTYIDKLKKNGVKFISDDVIPVDGKLVIFFEGPDGEKLELVQYV